MLNETAHIGGRVRSIVAVALRVLLCGVFLFSAVAKLAGIDWFELYIYSFGIFPLDWCFLGARCCIGAELVMAAMIAVGWWPRLTESVVVWVLALFSMVLCFAVMIGREDSCQCFGQWVDFSPAQSLVKNAVLIVLTLVCYRISPNRQASPSKTRRWMAVGVGVVLMALPFVVSVPDNWAFGESDIKYGKVALQEAMEEGGYLESYDLKEGRHVVAFLTPECVYCQMTRRKIEDIAARNRVGTERIVMIEPNDIGYEGFLEITRGSRPLVLIMEDGEVKSTCHYRNIKERQVVEYLQ